MATSRLGEGTARRAVSLFILCALRDAAPASVHAHSEKTGTKAVTAAWHADVELIVPVQRAVKQ